MKNPGSERGRVLLHMLLIVLERDGYRHRIRFFIRRRGLPGLGWGWGWRWSVLAWHWRRRCGSVCLGKGRHCRRGELRLGQWRLRRGAVRLRYWRAR